MLVQTTSHVCISTKYLIRIKIAIAISIVKHTSMTHTHKHTRLLLHNITHKFQLIDFSSEPHKHSTEYRRAYVVCVNADETTTTTKTRKRSNKKAKANAFCALGGVAVVVLLNRTNLLFF